MADLERPQTGPDRAQGGPSGEPIPVSTVGDIAAQFPQLHENNGNLRLQLSIDKSVSKVASWVIGLIIGCAIFLGIAIALCLIMIFEWRDAKTQAWLLSNDVMSFNALLEREGLKRPEDNDKGPENNIHYHPKPKEP